MVRVKNISSETITIQTAGLTYYESGGPKGYGGTDGVEIAPGNAAEFKKSYSAARTEIFIGDEHDRFMHGGISWKE